MGKTLALALFALAACGGGGGGTKMDAAIDTPGGGGTALTVKNYLAWCTVAVNGAATSAAAMQVVNVTPGSIPLVAMAKDASFEVSGNMWHHTDGDTGAGETGTVTGTGTATTSTAHVTVNSTAKCVWVCCPFAGGTGCAGIADQCP